MNTNCESFASSNHKFFPQGLDDNFSSASNEDKPLEIKSQRDLRSLAFHIIYAMEQFDYDISIESVVDNFRRGFFIDIPQDSYSVKLAKKVIANKEELDKQIEPHLKNWTLERLGVCTKLILRLAICELAEEDALPNVIINEAIELSKGFSEKDAYKFVNGVLDEIVKAKINEPKNS